MKKIITLSSWNVNSVRARLPIVMDYLGTYQPDIVCLQETKCEDHHFPSMIEEELGYNVAHLGQKTFNGVAILSKFPFDEVTTGLVDLDDAHMEMGVQSRYIEACLSVYGRYVRVASVYVPNGQEVGSDKYVYKLAFLQALYERMQTVIQPTESLDEISFFCGDYNIAPRDVDVYDPKKWGEGILCSPKEREAFFALKHLGFHDVFETLSSPAFTWWDYRAGSFVKNHGLRIDHILASPTAYDSLEKGSQTIHTDIRTLDKTSDHAPISVRVSVA